MCTRTQSCCVPARVARTRLIADPGPRAPRSSKSPAGSERLTVCWISPAPFGPSERSVERLARAPGRMAALVGPAEQLLDLHDNVVGRARSPMPWTDADHEHDPDFGVTVTLGCARSPQVSDPRHKPRRRARHRARAIPRRARRAPRAIPHAGRTPQSHRGRRRARRPERPEARQWMVPRHSADEVPADRKCGEQGPQCWQGGAKKSLRRSLASLPDWEEPRHDGRGTVTPSPGVESTASTNLLHRGYKPRIRESGAVVGSLPTVR